MTVPSSGPEPTPEPTSQPADPVWTPPIPPSEAAEGVGASSAVGAPVASPEPTTAGAATSQPPGRRRWLEVALLVGAFIVVGGIGFAAGRTIDDQGGRARAGTHMIVGDEGQGGQRPNRQQAPNGGMFPGGGFGPGDGSGGFRQRGPGSRAPGGRMPGGQFPIGPMPGGRMLPGYEPQPGATPAPDATQAPLATPTPSASPAQ